MARFFYGYCLSAHPVPNHRVSISSRNNEYASERLLGIAMERWNDGTMERWNEKSVATMSEDG